MGSPIPRSWPGAPRQRWSPLVTVVPYLLLVLLALFTVAMKRSAVGSLLIDLGLCALVAGWMLGMFTLRPAWRERRPVMVVFFAGLVVLMAVLVVRDPWFGCLTPAGYFYAFRLLPWPWLLPGVAAVALVAGTAQAFGIDKSTVTGLLGYLAVLAVNVLPMCGFAWYTWHSARRNDERDQALAAVHEANRRLEATLAENAGLQQRLLTQAREAGVLDERQRMAREIHDTLAQGLIGIITQLQAAEQAGADPAQWRRHLDAATGLARESLAEARRSVHALRPQPLETGRLTEAVTEVADRWSVLHRIAVRVTTTGTVRPVPPETGAALLRTAQEALANVARHAHASRVGVTLSYMEREVALDVRDDGRGFDPAQLDAGGSGDGGDGTATGPAGRRRLRPGRDAAADRGPGWHPPDRIGTGHGYRDLGVRAGRADGEPGMSPGTGGRSAERAGAPIRLLVVDDHPVVRDGLSGMFAPDPDFEVLGEAADGAEAVQLAETMKPDVILMDLRMPGTDGLTAIRELARRGVAARVLVLTTYDTDSYVLPAIEAGATGYLLKDAPRAELLRAVRAAADGQSVLSPSVATRLVSRVRTPVADPLSQRELEVLGLVAAGNTNREAAARLFISEATVKTHLLNIYAKLGVGDRAAAVAEAYNQGLLTPGTAEPP